MVSLPIRMRHSTRILGGQLRFCSTSRGSMLEGSSAMAPREVAFLFDQVSRNKAASLKTWNTYCSNFLMPVIDQLTIDEMLTVIRSMVRARFRKFAVTNKVNRRLTSLFYGQTSADPAKVGRLLNDLAKLDSLDDMTTRTLCRATKFDES
ncbi:hypothetical protein FOZ62_028614, partial [Perkinsus olseni]